MKSILALLFLAAATFAFADPIADVTVVYRPSKGDEFTATLPAHNLTVPAVIKIESPGLTWLLTITPQDREHSTPTDKPVWTLVQLGEPSAGAETTLLTTQSLVKFDTDREIKVLDSSTKGTLSLKFSNLTK